MCDKIKKLIHPDTIYYAMEVKMNTIKKGFGLYATKQYVKDSIVFVLSGPEFDQPTRETIYVGNNTHVYDDCGIFINHSFTPTTIISGYDVIAIQNIEVGDEITFNYNESEMNMAAPFSIGDVMVCGKQQN